MAQSGADYAEQVQYAAKGRGKSRSVAPLAGIWPFLRPHRGTLFAAIAAMLVAAAATLVLPMAGGGLIDHGFDKAEAARISQYFLAFLAVAAVMGVSSAIRYYYVTWLGERVIADLRKAVFDNVIALSPSFFEVTRTGEVLSRLTADTTLIQTVVGSSASVAARNAVMLVGGLAMMFVTSLKLATLVVGAVALVLVPLILFGRWVRTLSRKSQDKIADTSAHASETLNAVQTVQAFTHEDYERSRFAEAVEDFLRLRGVAYARARRDDGRGDLRGLRLHRLYRLGGCARCDHGTDDRRLAGAIHHLRHSGGGRRRRAQRNLG